MTREWKISHLLSKVGEALVSEVKEGWLLMLLTSCLRLLLLLLTQQQETVVGKAAQRRRRWTTNNSRRRRVLVLRSGLEEAMLAAACTAAARTALPMRSLYVARSGRRGRRLRSRRFAAEIFGFRFFHLGGFGALPLFGEEELQLAARRRLLEKTLVGWLGPVHNNTQL